MERIGVEEVVINSDTLDFSFESSNVVGGIDEMFRVLGRYRVVEDSTDRYIPPSSVLCWRGRRIVGVRRPGDVFLSKAEADDTGLHRLPNGLPATAASLEELQSESDFRGYGIRRMGDSSVWVFRRSAPFVDYFHADPWHLLSLLETEGKVEVLVETKTVVRPGHDGSDWLHKGAHEEATVA